MKLRFSVIISHLNVKSYRKNYLALSSLLHATDIDILCISETFLKPEHSNSLSIPGYTLYRNDRTHKVGDVVAKTALKDPNVK